MPWTISDLHMELAMFYRQYRGIPAPANTFTESLWRRIEEIESRAKR